MYIMKKMTIFGGDDISYFIDKLQKVHAAEPKVWVLLVQQCTAEVSYFNQ